MRTYTFYLLLFIFSAFISLPNVSCEEDFYSILGIDRDSSAQEMKKKHRELNLKYHPDRNGGNRSASDMFMKINRAFEVLSNDEMKKIYDIYGEEGLNHENLMQQQNRPKGPNATVEMETTLEELYNGAKKELSINKKVVCKKCHGTGGKLGKTKKCNHCKGKGIRMENVDTGMGFTLKMQNTCSMCKGSGITFSENCEVCFGKKLKMQEQIFNIDIEKGMRNGQQIVLRGESEQSPDYRPGDLVIILKQEKHEFFHTRKDLDLYGDFKLTLKEALLGYSKTIKHLDNRQITIDSKLPTQPFYVRKIANEGMPQHHYNSHKGEMFIKFTVQLPARLTDEEKIIVEQLFD